MKITVNSRPLRHWKVYKAASEDTSDIVRVLIIRFYVWDGYESCTALCTMNGGAPMGSVAVAGSESRR